MSDNRKKMATIQALLDRADHENTPAPEAEACRAKAEELMVKYRIEEEMLRVTKLASGTAEQPIMEEMIVCAYGNKYKEHYYSLAYFVAQHAGVRVVADYRKAVNDENVEEFSLILQMVGFESDIRYAEMLYTGVRLTFSSLLEPKVNPRESDEDNVYRLRSSGMERIRIAELMWGSGSHANNAKVTKLYAAACAARGEDPKVVGRSVNVKTFRGSYADAFVTRIYNRLNAMKATAGLESGALVLHGRKDAVDEAFYARFPHLRPKPSIEGQDYSGCAKCKRAKSGRCRDHSYSAGKAKPYSALGARAGRSAADTADLSGGRTPKRTGRLEA